MIVSGGGARVQELSWPPAIPYPMPQVAVSTLASRPTPGRTDPSAEQVLIASGRHVAVMDARSAQVVHRTTRLGVVTAASFHPNRNSILLGAIGGWAEVALDSKSVTVGDTLPNYLRVTSFAVPRGGELFTSVVNSVRIYPQETGQPKTRRIELPPSDSESAGQIIVDRAAGELVVVRGRRVEFLDPNTGVSRRPTLVAADEILATSYASPSRALATGYRGRSAQVWDLSQTPPVPGRLLNHSRAVISVALRPDGRAVLTGSRDGTAQVWDVASGLVLGPKLRHRSPVTAVAWSADPLLAFTGAADGEAAGWPVETEPERGTLAELRTRYGRLPNNSLTE